MKRIHSNLVSTDLERWAKCVRYEEDSFQLEFLDIESMARLPERISTGSHYNEFFVTCGEKHYNPKIETMVKTSTHTRGGEGCIAAPVPGVFSIRGSEERQFFVALH